MNGTTQTARMEHSSGQTTTQPPHEFRRPPHDHRNIFQRLQVLNNQSSRIRPLQVFCFGGKGLQLQGWVWWAVVLSRRGGEGRLLRRMSLPSKLKSGANALGGGGGGSCWQPWGGGGTRVPLNIYRKMIATSR